MDPIYGLYFGHNIKLNNNSSASHPRVTVSDNYVYVVWTSNSSSEGNGEINFRMSSNNGASFQAAKNLSNNPGNSTNAIVTAHRNNVYVVWTDDTMGNTDIYFRKSSDYGNNFNKTLNLSRTNGSSLSPQLAASDNHVYVVWTDDTRGNNDINLKASHDYGNNFDRTRPVSRTNGSSLSPQLAASDNHVYVVWTDDTRGNSDLNLKASHDYGNSLNRTRPVSRTNGSSLSPQLAVSDNYVYVLWTEAVSQGNSDIVLKTSFNHGSNFTNTARVSRTNGSSLSPQLAVSDNYVYVLWSEAASQGNSEIYFRKSSYNGTTIAGGKNISEDFSRSSDPKLAILGDDKLYITWTNISNDKSEISFEASGDGGEHFDNTLSLSASLPSHFSHSSHIIASKNNIYAVWVEDGPASEGDIYFKRISETFFPRNSK
jgi:LVIVD repeat